MAFVFEFTKPVAVVQKAHQNHSLVPRKGSPEKTHQPNVTSITAMSPPKRLRRRPDGTDSNQLSGAASTVLKHSP